MATGQERSRTLRVYSAEERRQAVAEASAMGSKAAASKLGIPSSSVWRWVRAARGEAAGSVTSGNTAIELGDSASPSLEARKPRVAKKYSPSLKAEVLEYERQHGVTKTFRQFGISRWTIYDWKRRIQRAALGHGPSPTSGEDPKTIEERRDREILAEWHRHPGLGPSQIRNQLRRAGVKVSVHTTRRVMEESGYRPPKVVREPHDERFEAVRPNHLWHLDFVQRYINRATTFTLILIDDYSRFVVGHGVAESEQASLVIDVFEEAVRRHGKPERVIHDKGSAFWSWRGISRFTALLTELGIDQMVAEHKEWNGKLESFNGNLHSEFFDVMRFFDVAEMRRRLAGHLAFYNYQRTHHALGGLLVPADRYHGRSEEVLARIEAGGGRELGDGLNLSDRLLEFFKVVGKGGAVELWLLGQKLLSLGS